jgi:hypothetical protein
MKIARKLATKHRRLRLIVVSESKATSPHSSMRTGTQRQTKRHAAALTHDQRQPISVHTTLSPTSMCGIGHDCVRCACTRRRHSCIEAKGTLAMAQTSKAGFTLRKTMPNRVLRLPAGLLDG